MATLAIFAESPRGPHDTVRRYRPSTSERAGIVERKLFAVVASKACLVVERIDMARPALHEDEDRPFRASRVMGRLRGRRGSPPRLPSRPSRGNRTRNPPSKALDDVRETRLPIHRSNSFVRLQVCLMPTVPKSKLIYVAKIDAPDDGLHHTIPACGVVREVRISRSWR